MERQKQSVIERIEQKTNHFKQTYQTEDMVNEATPDPGQHTPTQVINTIAPTPDNSPEDMRLTPEDSQVSTGTQSEQAQDTPYRQDSGQGSSCIC